MFLLDKNHRCPGTYCDSKLECARAIKPEKNEIVTWAALYVRLQEGEDRCDQFVKKA